MEFIRQAGAAVLLITLSLWLLCGGIAVLVPWVRRALARDVKRLGPFHAAGLVVRITTVIVMLHGLEILLWASCYRWLCFPSWDSAFYFSATSYSTVGYGDVILPSNWRILGPLESVIGVLLCGISVSFLFVTINRLVEREVEAHE